MKYIHMLKAITLSIVFSLLATAPIKAQETETESTSTYFKWGLNSGFTFESISQYHPASEVSMNNVQPLTTGAFVEFQKFEMKIEFMTTTFNYDLKYIFWKGAFVTTKGQINKYCIEFPKDYSSSYSSYYDDEYYDYSIGGTQYYGGLGYTYTLLGRLKMSASALIGSIQTEALNHSEAIYPNFYSDRNRKAQLTNNYQLEPTFVYGGNIYFEWLSSPKRNRKHPVSAFFSVDVLKNTSSHTSRSVSIEEWVPGNVVYREDAQDSGIEYDINKVEVKMGIKFFIRN